LSADSLPMMPWFPRDFIASTRAMRPAERGAYRELLDFQWELGVLPTDEQRLARLIGYTKEEFDDVWPAIKYKFVPSNGGLVNERLEEHRKKALEQREKKRRGASTTNAKRGAERDGERGAERSQKVVDLRDASATPPSPSPSVKEEDSRRGDKSPPKDLIWSVGVDLLTSAGEKNTSARSFLGKLCKDFGDDTVREAVGRAAAVAPADPKSWLQGALKRSTGAVEPPRAI
jgi:uncharacterized protein YdaU (DUF1376 family)